MNADRTRDVRARFSVAAKVPFLLWLGIGLSASAEFSWRLVAH
jgi:hypothetical protein